MVVNQIHVTDILSFKPKYDTRVTRHTDRPSIPYDYLLTDEVGSPAGSCPLALSPHQDGLKYALFCQRIQVEHIADSELRRHISTQRALDLTVEDMIAIRTNDTGIKADYEISLLTDLPGILEVGRS